ncbi:MAG: family 43 glycosylhydrolase, partial [Prevotellaceae bacterium]|nr:family 43 glycosylhydrolase [Prevotellaceae bacterium]
MKHLFFPIIFLIALYGCKSQQPGNNIISGISWFDNNGNAVNAHGACIVEENGRYYLFGEYKSDTANVFTGFSCYSSTDLVNWQFERIVLPQQKDGLLGPNRVGERVKVMRCPATGEYVMYMHCDDSDYNDPHIGYATCNTVNGDYEFQGALLYAGQPVKRWDMGTFQDDDGKGYLLIHHGDIYRLNDNYKSAEKLLPHIQGMGESPVVFKKGGVYFLLSSNLTSWERNDNMYHTASSIEGPWTKQGLFAPEGTLTYNSQCTFVFPQICNENTEPMYMGDRWSFPKQGSCATYVWLPLHVEGTKLTLQKPENVMPEGKNLLEKPFVSNTEGDFAEVKFSGRQIAVYGESNAHGGYGRMTITDKNGRTVVSSPVDFYSKVPDRAVRYISPQLPQGDYTLKVEVTGENSTWSDKKMSISYGSDDYFVNIENIIQIQ